MEDNNSVEIISNPFKKGIFNTQGSHPAKIQAEYTNYCKPPAYPYNQMPVPPAYPYTPMVGNYNFNINMNLFLSNLPSYANPPMMPSYMHYQQMYMNQLNQQPSDMGFGVNPNPNYQQRPVQSGYEAVSTANRNQKGISYIVIDS